MSIDAGLTLPEYLVSTDWLESNLDKPSVRVFDCSVYAEPNPDADKRKQFPFIFTSGQEKYKGEHIPGAGFIDIVGSLSDSTAEYPLMMLGKEQFAEVMGAYGIGQDARVILYSNPGQWACRVWWMLRAFGFNAAILDGGFNKWNREEREVSDSSCVYPRASFVGKKQARSFVSKDVVVEALQDKSVCTISALPAEMFSGSSAMSFGRKGHIEGSINIPFGSLYEDTGSEILLDSEQLHKIFDTARVGEAERIIAYCGSGIAASNLAFALTISGYENVSVYDASMCEWGNDPSLPMSVG